MNLKRKLLALSIITVISSGMYYCNRSNIQEGKARVAYTTSTLGDVFKYIDNNPHNEDLIINYIVDNTEESQSNFSRETIKNLANLIKQEVENNPIIMKEYVLDITSIGLRSSYRKEIWQQLTKEEKWVIFREVSKYKAEEYWDQTKEVAKDAYSKFKETELYDKMGKAKNKIKDVGKDLISKKKKQE